MPCKSSCLSSCGTCGHVVARGERMSRRVARWASLPLLLLAAPSLVAGELYRVCLVQNPGFVNCTVGGDPLKFSGLEIELISLVAANLGWVQVRDATDAVGMNMTAYTLVCTDQRVPSIINVLTNKSNSPDMNDCALGMGAFTATSERVQMGARFSWPHLHSSLGVMVAADAQQTRYDKWAFMKPLAPQIWVAVLLTTVLTPCILLMFENVIQTGRIPVGFDLLTEWRHASYVMFLCCFNLQVLEVLSWPCQLMVVCFAFTNLIIVASYTANLAAVLTAAAVSGGIQTIRDLYGRTVAAHALYVERLLRNEFIRAIPLSWDGEPTFLQVKQQLLDDTLDAYIFDRAILQYWMGHDDPMCQLRLLTNTQVEPFDYGVAFNWRIQDSVVRNFSLGVLTVQSTGMLSILEERYISGALDACSNQGSSIDSALQFAQVSGLFIILGAAAGLGFLVSLYAVWWHHIGKPRKQKQRALKQQQGEGPSDMNLSHGETHTPMEHCHDMALYSKHIGSAHLPGMHEEEQQEEEYVSVEKAPETEVELGHTVHTVKVKVPQADAHAMRVDAMQKDEASSSPVQVPVHGHMPEVSRPGSQESPQSHCTAVSQSPPCTAGSQQPSTSSQTCTATSQHADSNTVCAGPASRRVNSLVLEEAAGGRGQAGAGTQARQGSGARTYWSKLSKVATASRRLASQVFVVEKKVDKDAQLQAQQMPPYFARTFSNMSATQEPQLGTSLISVSALQKRTSQSGRQLSPSPSLAYTPYVMAPSTAIQQPHPLSGQLHEVADNSVSHMPDAHVSRQRRHSQVSYAGNGPQPMLMLPDGRIVPAPLPYGPGPSAVGYPPTQQHSATTASPLSATTATPVAARSPSSHHPLHAPTHSPSPHQPLHAPSHNPPSHQPLHPPGHSPSPHPYLTHQIEAGGVAGAGQRPHLVEARSLSQGAARSGTATEGPAVSGSASIEGRAHMAPQLQ